jgi:hypothetical protein
LEQSLVSLKADCGVMKGYSWLFGVAVEQVEGEARLPQLWMSHFLSSGTKVPVNERNSGRRRIAGRSMMTLERAQQIFMQG